jgi:hypothetical protein
MTVLQLEFQPTPEETEDLALLDEVASDHESEFGTLDLDEIRFVLNEILERPDLLQRYRLDHGARLRRASDPEDDLPTDEDVNPLRKEFLHETLEFAAAMERGPSAFELANYHQKVTFLWSQEPGATDQEPRVGLYRIFDLLTTFKKAGTLPPPELEELQGQMERLTQHYQDMLNAPGIV